MSVVGFLTALVAFFIVRSERWLFDFKEGHCTNGWWKAREVCCSYLESASSNKAEPTCASWQTWDQLFDPHKGGNSWGIYWAIEYISYTVAAVRDTQTNQPQYLDRC